MTNVHVSTKYCIAQEDLELLADNKRKWWLRGEKTGFVKGFPVIACTSPVDIEIDLPDDEYTLGTGDYNTVNDAGKHLSQRTYFYIAEGTLRYCKRSEFPSQSGASQTTLSGYSAPASGGYNPFGGAPAQNAPTFTKIEDSVYCLERKEFTVSDYNCITCYFASDDTGLEQCSTCAHHRDLFYSNKA